MDDLRTEERTLLYDTTRRFVEEQSPLAATRLLHDDVAGFNRAWYAETAELGWYSMLVPERHGGGSISDEGLLDLAVIADVIGRFVQPGPFLVVNVVADAVARHGTDEQQAMLLPGIVAGELLATWAPFDLTGEWDEGRGLDVHVDPIAGECVLTGSRGLVQDAAVADHLLVLGSGGGHPMQLLVPADAPGLVIEPLQCFDVSHRIAEVHFDGVRIPATAVLGSDDAQRAAIERALHVAVVLACAEAVGALDTMLTMTVEYAKGRIAFGRPIGAFQALKHVMADLAMFVAGCKVAAEAAVRAVSEGADDAAEVVSMAASYIEERSMDIAQEAIQLHGGIAFTWEHDLHLLIRRVRFNASIWCDRIWHRERICEVYGL